VKELLIILIVVLGISFFIISIFGILLLMIYVFGYSVGWFIHLFVGPNLIYGFEFEQFVGLTFMLVSILNMKISPKYTNKEQN